MTQTSISTVPIRITSRQIVPEGIPPILQPYLSLTEDSWNELIRSFQEPQQRYQTRVSIVTFLWPVLILLVIGLVGYALALDNGLLGLDQQDPPVGLQWLVVVSGTSTLLDTMILAILLYCMEEELDQACEWAEQQYPGLEFAFDHRNKILLVSVENEIFLLQAERLQEKLHDALGSEEFETIREKAMIHVVS